MKEQPQESYVEKKLQEQVRPISFRSSFWIVLAIHLFGGVGFISLTGGTKTANAEDKKFLESKEAQFAGIETPTPTPVVTPTPTATPTPTPTPTVAGYTMTQVRANNTSRSCWTVIDGVVYDLTKWISNHPGGSGAILFLCGTDGTNAFSAQHQNQARPAIRLDTYRLGPLNK